jgi:NADPH:quinone reductase-like Zn-dependent oxidoreductase
LHGFRTINVVRRKEQGDELKALGADQVLVESDGPLPEQVRRVVGEGGVPFVMDPVGGRTGSQAIECLGNGGRAILYGLLSGEPVTVDPRFLITGSKRVEGFWLADWARSLPMLKKVRLLRRIRGLMREGILTTEIGRTFPLDQVADAVRAAESPGRGGKVLLRIASGS